MTMQRDRRTIVRTPRRRKVWAQFNETTVLGSGTSTPKIIDMLSAYYSDLGAGQQGGLTVMRILGRIQLESFTAEATTPNYERIAFGIAWQDRLVANASDGDSNIPEPLLDGIRETNWIQQWRLGALEEAGTPVVPGIPLTPQEKGLSWTDVDIRQMRKQPNAAAELCYVISGGSGYEANTVAAHTELSILLALP